MLQRDDGGGGVMQVAVCSSGGTWMVNLNFFSFNKKKNTYLPDLRDKYIGKVKQFKINK